MSDVLIGQTKRGGEPGVPVRPIQNAYEQVAGQLRELIESGELVPGSRLPTEPALAARFGVSRPTVREALRVLAAQDLIQTTRGPGGGNTVKQPSVDHISAYLNSSLGLLSEHDVSLDEFLEARELLETRAARLAALRHDEDDVERLEQMIPTNPMALSTQEQFAYNRDFHAVVLEAARNTLLYIAARPVFSVLQTNLARSTLGRAYHKAINAQHREIADAIAAKDPDAAEHLMRAHLEYLRPSYEKAWRERPTRPR